MLEAEAAEYETELEGLVVAACPELLANPGVGVITAAQFLVSWSYSKRIRNEAAFAALAGVAAIPASSGATADKSADTVGGLAGGECQRGPIDPRGKVSGNASSDRALSRVGTIA